jgi:hypothetical protein
LDSFINQQKTTKGLWYKVSWNTKQKRKKIDDKKRRDKVN